MNDKKFKIAAAVLILGAGLIGSYLVVRNSGIKNLNTAAEIKNLIQKGGEALVQNPIQWIENNSSNNEKNNLTGALAQSVFEQFKMEKGLSDNDEINEVLKKQLTGLQLISQINDSELKISSDNSKEAKIRHLKTIGEINQKDVGDFKKTYLEVVIDVFQKLDSSSARRLADIYGKLANDYLAIEVPSDWLDLHKTTIVHFKNSQTVYSAMADYHNDPIKGYLALEIIENIAVDNAKEVIGLLNEKIREI